jgi:hypothetical protein
MPVSRFRSRIAPGLALVALLAGAFIGRAVISADGSWVLSETLGFLVTGRFEAATIQQPGEVTPSSSEAAAVHSKYGLFPSLVPLPFAAAVWPARGAVGGRGVDAAVSLTWAAGVGFAALAFVRLVRALRPEASLWWAPAFVAGTFLWPYAADSFLEPWEAALFALGAALLLDPGARNSGRGGALAGGVLSLAFLLKPILWVTAPVWLLVALGRARRSGRHIRFVAGFVGLELLALAVAGLANVVRHGSLWNTGYGGESLAFTSPILEGLSGLTVRPGRGVLFYAPLVLLALASARRLSRLQLLALFGIPVLLLLVVSRWWAWHGGSAWGPRLLLPVLPLLVAPAALARARLVVPFVLAGACLNLGGVLVAPGAFISYVEAIRPPSGSTWPAPGSDRVSSVGVLTPLWGHPWLFLRGAAGVRLPAPWLVAGAVEGAPPPSLAEFLSPAGARLLFGLPPVRPFVPRLLVRSAWAWALRGRPQTARLFLAEALRLDPADPDARRLRDALGP